MTLADYFGRLAHYHAWATQRLLDALAELDDTAWYGDAGLFFRSVHGTVNHLLVTDDIWYARFARGESLRLALDSELHRERAALGEALQGAVARWQGWLATLEPARFDGELGYTRGNGAEVRVLFTPALGHVFNHATHHRGQLTAALTAKGLAGPNLDWIYQQQQAAAAATPPV